MSSPLLTIRRVKVTGRLGCDLRFDRGLNVVKSVATEGHVRSTNKCGKTSLVELILHGFGRRPPNRTKWYFAPIADALDTLWLEVEANGRTITIQRSLRELGANLHIQEGPFTDASPTLPSESVPYEAMSDFMLDLLRIPKVSVRQADGSSFTLSFPNLWRLFILHQEDSFGQILDKMIPEQRRTDVVGFMTRITPLERYTIEEQLAATQRQLQELESRILAVEQFLRQHGVRTIFEISQQFENVSKQLADAIAERHELQRAIKSGAAKTPSTGHIDDLQIKLLAAKSEVATLQQQMATLQQEQLRLEDLLNSLRADLNQARRLQSSQTILSTVDFEICPRCMQAITKEMAEREHIGRCSLCNRTLTTTSDAAPRTTGRLDDINSQISEVESVLRDIATEKRTSSEKLSRAQVKNDNLSVELESESLAYVTPSVDALLAKSQEISELEKQTARLEPILAQATTLESMRDDLLSIRSSAAALQDQLRAASKPDDNRLKALASIYKSVLDHVGFPDVRDVRISPQTLLPFINGNLYTHVGTAMKGLATVSYHLALLSFASQFDTFIPRALVIDSPAVGDLNDENHDRLLQFLSRMNKPDAPEPEWQIILTTRRSNPALDACIVETLSSPHQMLLR